MVCSALARGNLSPPVLRPFENRYGAYTFVIFSSTETINALKFKVDGKVPTDEYKLICAFTPVFWEPEEEGEGIGDVPSLVPRCRKCPLDGKGEPWCVD